MADYPYATTSISPSGDTSGAKDTGLIQGALTAGSRVLLQPGVFWINQTLQFPSNTWLQGYGRGITTIRAKASFAASQVGLNAGMVMLATAGNNAASHITVSDLTLDMNEANTASVPGYAVAALCSPVGFQSATALFLERIETVNAIGYSMFPVSCTNVKIRGCRVITGQANNGYANQDGIHVTDCTGVIIEANYIDTGTIVGVGDDGIAVQGVSTGCFDVTVTGNVIEHAAAHGITLVLGGAAVTGVTVTGNVVENCQNEGLLAPFYNTYVNSPTYLLTDVAVTGNVFRNVALNGNASGLTLQDAFGGTGAHAGTPGYAGIGIAGNTFDTASTTGFGIYAQAGSGLTINDNTLRNWKSVRGIDIGDNSSATSRTVSNAQVSDNIIDMSATAQASPFGVCVVDSPGVVVIGNTVIGPGVGVAGGIGVNLLSIGTAITGAVIDSNKVTAWATAISETNNGVAPNFNVFTGNNCHGNTVFISTVGVSDVVASNVVA